jgi:hypothetical protein
MIRVIASLFFSAVLANAQLTVSDISAIEVSHSYVALKFTASGTPNAMRVRYGHTTSYEEGPGGGIAAYAFNAYATEVTANVPGLKASQQYEFCPQVSDDGGSTWSPCVNFTATTLALPAVHPVPPEPPPTVDRTFPDISSCTIRNVASDCSDLQSKLDAAALDQLNNCSLVRIPKAAACSGNYTLSNDPSVGSFSYTAVDTTDDLITINDHGFAEGDQIRLYGGCPINCDTEEHFQWATGLISGVSYYIRNPTTNTFQLSLSADGDIIDFTVQGEGTHYYMPWPPVENEIIIMTDGALPPPGLAVGPEWSANMPKLRPAGAWTSLPNTTFTALPFAHHYRFLGLDLTQGDYAAANTDTTNPPGAFAFVTLGDRSNHHFVFDRCLIRGLGFPNRVYRPLTIHGSEHAIIDSYLANLSWWRPLYQLTADFTSTTATFGGNYYGLNDFVIDPPATLTITGGTSSTAIYAYITMEGVFTWVIPTGMTGNCTGYASCQVINADTPNWALNGSGRAAVYGIGTVGLSSGTITGAFPLSIDYTPLFGVIGSTILLGYGPGPFLIDNNTVVDSFGVTFHADDSPTPIFFTDPKGYTYTRNKFYSTLPQCFTGKIWGHRHYLEWKNGTHIRIDGNEFANNCYEGATPNQIAVNIMAVAGGRVSDVQVTNNIFRDSGAGMAAVGPFEETSQAGRRGKPPLARTLIDNNLFYNIDGWRHSFLSTFFSNSQGYGIDARMAVEDYVVTRNLFHNLDTFGNILRISRHPSEGWVVADNVIFANSGAGIISAGDGGLTSGYSPAFTMDSNGKAMLDFMWRAGLDDSNVPIPSYVMKGNAIVPWYGNGATLSGLINPATLCAKYDGSWNAGTGVCTSEFFSQFQSQGSTTLNAGLMKWMNFDSRNFRWKPDSPLRSGAKKSYTRRGIGPNIRELEQAQGWIKKAYVKTKTTTTATIIGVVPDLGSACYVGYGTVEDVTDSSWTYTAANVQNSRVRTFELTSLTPGETYYYHVGCYRTKPTTIASFTTQTE